MGARLAKGVAAGSSIHPPASISISYAGGGGASRRRPASNLERELGVAVDVLVEEVAEVLRPAGVAGLGAEGAHPDKVTCAGRRVVAARTDDRFAAGSGVAPASTSIQSLLTL